MAGSVDKLTCCNKSVTSVWLVAGVYSQPRDHIRGEEAQRGGAMNTSTHTLPDSLQRTCRASSSLHVWPRSRSLRRSPRATSCQISCPWILWSSSLHSGKDNYDKEDQSTKNIILLYREWGLIVLIKVLTNYHCQACDSNPLQKPLTTDSMAGKHSFPSKHNAHEPHCWWQTFRRL